MSHALEEAERLLEAERNAYQAAKDVAELVEEFALDKVQSTPSEREQLHEVMETWRAMNQEWRAASDAFLKAEFAQTNNDAEQDGA